MTLSRVVLTTGGTGGHIFPALAVAEELRALNPGARIVFMGGTYGPERGLAERAGLEFVGLPVRGVLGRGLRAAASLGRMAWALGLAMRALSGIKPQAVAGFGGYAGFCPVLAARLMGIPTALHEQNSMPGMSNRVLARVADRIFVSFPDAAGSFPAGKVELTGNPVRGAIMAAGATSRTHVRGNVLVVGGSQGASALNRAVVRDLAALKGAGVSLWHQTGARDLEATAQAYHEAGMTGCTVAPFIEDMAAAYAWADLVVCRSGASTVAEVAVAGLPAIFVPFPHATHDHQTANARFLADQGAALLAPESELAAGGLAARITALLGDARGLQAMGAAAAALARPDAARRVARGIAALARN